MAAPQAVPTIPAKPKKEGDAYTIWGVTHELRSRVHREEVNGKKISLVGYVVKTNYTGLINELDLENNVGYSAPVAIDLQRRDLVVSQVTAPGPSKWIRRLS